MRVIVAGSTTWENAKSIHAELSELPDGSVVIYGDAPGADELGGSIARQLGLEAEPWAKNHEDYRRYQRVAWKGLNERMLASGAELILAFHPDVDSSTGTKHLLELARDAGVTIKVVRE